MNQYGNKRYKCVEPFVFDGGTDLEYPVQEGTVWTVLNKEDDMLYIQNIGSSETFRLSKELIKRHFKLEKDVDFEGFDYMELVPYFNLEQKQESILGIEGFNAPEEMEQIFFLGTQKIKVSTSKKEEVERIKLENFITKALQAKSEDSIKVREDLNRFLDKLIETGSKYIAGDTINMFKAIRSIESDSEFSYWFVHNIQALWI